MATHWDNIFLAPGLGQVVASATWTPASSTTDGGVSVHTWHNPAVAQFQDSALTTPAVSDGDPVGGSTSQGTDAHSIIQAVTAAKPTLKLNIAAINNQPVWRMDGGDWLQAAFLGGTLSQPYVLLAVGQLSAAVVNDGTRYVMLDGKTVGEQARIRQEISVSPNKFSYYAGNEILGSVSNANWHIWTIAVNGLSSAVFDGGNSEASGNLGSQNLTGLSLGSTFLPSGYWVGDIAQVLIYPGLLSTADKNQVGQYLATKFNLSYTDIV